MPCFFKIKTKALMAWNEIDLFDGKIVNMVYGGLLYL
jgi:hypothetical protein